MASDFMMPTKTAANPVAATKTTAYSAVAAPSSGSTVSVRIRASSRHTVLPARSRMACSSCPALPIRPSEPSMLIGVSLFMAFLSFEQPRPDGRVHPVLRIIVLVGTFFKVVVGGRGLSTTTACHPHLSAKHRFSRIVRFPHFPRQISHVAFLPSFHKRHNGRNNPHRNKRRKKAQSSRQQQADRQLCRSLFDLRTLIPIQLFDRCFQTFHRRGATVP